MNAVEARNGTGGGCGLGFKHSLADRNKSSLRFLHCIEILLADFVGGVPVVACFAAIPAAAHTVFSGPRFNNE